MNRPDTDRAARRTLFTGQTHLRPPWSNETRVMDACTSCGACVAACPEGILVSGPGKTPVVDFTKGECTFCGACAAACQEPVFLETTNAPWTAVATVGKGCLNTHGISCQLCTDTCDARALRFDISVRPVGKIQVDTLACTGCGACVGICPEAAISVSPVVGAHHA